MDGMGKQDGAAGWDVRDDEVSMVMRGAEFKVRDGWLQI